MKSFLQMFVLVAVVAIASTSHADDNSEPTTEVKKRSPKEPAAQSSGPAKGTLVIVGGGGVAAHQKKIIARFIELAGGDEAKIVVVPTAASSSEKYNYANPGMLRWIRRDFKVKHSSVVHTHDREVADTDAFIKPLTEATGIWLTGGRQWRLTKAYRGTKAEKAFQAVLDRGGVIGGSSAGATIQGSFLARGDTRGSNIMIGDFQHGFGYLKNVAIDQHIVPRKRQLDMIEILEDPNRLMRPVFDREAMLGLGIDEDTAIVVKGNSFEVIGKPNSVVFVYNPRTWTKDTPANSKYIKLGFGDKYDLHQRKTTHSNEANSK